MHSQLERYNIYSYRFLGLWLLAAAELAVDLARFEPGIDHELVPFAGFRLTARRILLAALGNSAPARVCYVLADSASLRHLNKIK